MSQPDRYRWRLLIEGLDGNTATMSDSADSSPIPRDELQRLAPIIAADADVSEVRLQRSRTWETVLSWPSEGGEGA